MMAYLAPRAQLVDGGREVGPSRAEIAWVRGHQVIRHVDDRDLAPAARPGPTDDMRLARPHHHELEPDPLQVFQRPGERVEVRGGSLGSLALELISAPEQLVHEVRSEEHTSELQS